jgi:hypothetical protein
VVAIAMEGEGITWSDNDGVENGDSYESESYRRVRT